MKLVQLQFEIKDELVFITNVRHPFVNEHIFWFTFVPKTNPNQSRIQSLKKEEAIELLVEKICKEDLHYNSLSEEQKAIFFNNARDNISKMISLML